MSRAKIRKSRNSKLLKWSKNFLHTTLIKVVIASLLYLLLKGKELEAWKTAYEIVDFIF